jgi:hypothetical protein
MSEKAAIDWAAIRSEYESGSSLRTLAAKYHVSKSVIGERKFTEQWDKLQNRTPKRTKSFGQRASDISDMHPTINSTDKKGLSTKDKQRLFLEIYAQQANVLLSARAAGIHRSTVYEWLEHDEDFSFAYNLAKEDAKDTLRAEIFRRAHEGWDEEVYQLGNFAGTVHKYSDTLLIFHAKMLMPEYRDKQQVDVTTHTGAKDTQETQDAIMKALEPYPEAKWALAEALAELEKTSK